jgi:hypothetical protein
MVNAGQIKEQMEVKGSDGKHVGTVEGMDGDQIQIASGGMIHTIELDAVAEVKGDIVKLKQTAQEATKPWH